MRSVTITLSPQIKFGAGSVTKRYPVTCNRYRLMANVLSQVTGDTLITARGSL